METPQRKSPTYLPEVSERAIRKVFGHCGQHASRWAAIESIAGKIGCTMQTLCG